jgi:chromosome partitioning protein
MDNKVITIAQQKGGAGKTTIAAHLAVALSQRGQKVAVIDIDPQGSLTQWHKIREERFGEGYTGINFSSLSGWRINSEISRLKRDFDIIVIDSPPHMETEARTAIRAADLLIIPVQPSPTDLWATKATIDLAAKEKVLAKILLNRLNPNSKLAQLVVAELDRDSIFQNTLGNRVAFASSLLEGRCVTETAPSSPASKEFKLVAEEILSLVNPELEIADVAKKILEEV